MRTRTALVEFLKESQDYRKLLKECAIKSAFRLCAQTTSFLASASRLEEGLAQEISVVRSVTSIEDALQMLEEEREKAEEA
jgi:hypothetical protein